MCRLTARSDMLPLAMSLLVVSPPPPARSILLLSAGRVPTAGSRLLLAVGRVPAAGSRLLLAAGCGLRGVVVVLVLVRPPCAWWSLPIRRCLVVIADLLARLVPCLLFAVRIKKERVLFFWSCPPSDP